jgi:hypothetical protein
MPPKKTLKRKVSPEDASVTTGTTGQPTAPDPPPPVDGAAPDPPPPPVDGAAPDPSPPVDGAAPDPPPESDNPTPAGDDKGPAVEPMASTESTEAKGPEAKAKPKRKAKAAADESKPKKAKRPPNAFMIYCSTHRARVKQEGITSVTEIAKKLGEEWKALTEDGKRHYTDMAAKEKEAMKEAEAAEAAEAAGTVGAAEAAAAQ